MNLKARSEASRQKIIVFIHFIFFIETHSSEHQAAVHEVGARSSSGQESVGEEGGMRGAIQADQQGLQNPF